MKIRMSQQQMIYLGNSLEIYWIKIVIDDFISQDRDLGDLRTCGGMHTHSTINRNPQTSTSIEHLRAPLQSIELDQLDVFSSCSISKRPVRSIVEKH